mgnify:CR=1 FL=1
MKKRNGVNLYPEIQVKWIPGHHPDLLIRDKGKTEKVDLTDFKSRDEVHTYLQSRGFTNTSPKYRFPRDKNEKCEEWAARGDCMSNSLYMHEYCPLSCNKSEL